jgi:hypothetical protein
VLKMPERDAETRVAGSSQAAGWTRREGALR